MQIHADPEHWLLNPTYLSKNAGTAGNMEKLFSTVLVEGRRWFSEGQETRFVWPCLAAVESMAELERPGGVWRGEPPVKDAENTQDHTLSLSNNTQSKEYRVLLLRELRRTRFFLFPRKTEYFWFFLKIRKHGKICQDILLGKKNHEHFENYKKMNNDL